MQRPFGQVIALDRCPLGVIWSVVDQDDSSIRKRTPAEQARAVRTDRRARYEAKKEREGYKRALFYVKADKLEQVRQLIAEINEA